MNDITTKPVHVVYALYISIMMNNTSYHVMNSLKYKCSIIIIVILFQALDCLEH